MLKSEEHVSTDKDTIHSGSYQVEFTEKWLFVLLLIFRAVNALLCRTLFVPDEHWQSLEIAYRTVFQYPSNYL